MSDELAQLLDPDLVDQLHGNAVFGKMRMRQRFRNAGLFRVVLKQPVTVLRVIGNRRSPLGTFFSHSVIAGFSSVLNPLAMVYLFPHSALFRSNLDTLLEVCSRDTKRRSPAPDFFGTQRNTFAILCGCK